MPRAYKKRTTRKKTYKRRKSMARTVRQIQSAFELKSQDTSAVFTPGGAPVVTYWTGLLRGDDIGNRIGRQVTWKSIYQRMTLQAVATTTIPHFVRYILFWYKDPSGAPPTPLQMFGAAAPGINAMMNLNVRKDFVVLKDMVIRYSPVTGDQSNVFKKLYIKTNVKSIYNAGNTGLIGDQEAWALYSFCWCETNVAAELASVQIQGRNRFVDA